MAEFPRQVIDAVRCEKCNYGYKSALTVFAEKDLSYESRCPKCSHVNKKTLKKERMLASPEEGEKGEDRGRDGGKGKKASSGSTRDTPKLLRNAKLRGFYLSFGAIMAYLVGSFLGWTDMGNMDGVARFLTGVSVPVFGLGVIFLLYGIADSMKHR